MMGIFQSPLSPGFGIALRAILAALILSCTGCSSTPKQTAANWTTADNAGLALPFFDADVDALCTPPVGWNKNPLKSSSNHVHQVWLSPTGDTAYGVIHFKIPLPVGQNLAFDGFLSQMKQTEGEATLLERHDDPSLPGIRFVAAGGMYVIRANLFVATWEGWTVYAGTLKSGPILQNELDLAIRAREHTRVGRPGN
jgi:hypothetical protein